MNYLLDTDFGPDCDDAAALALAVLYARKYGGRLLAVTHCTSSPWGVGAIRRVLQWYGAEAEVGTLKDAGFLTAPEMEKYNRALALSVSPAEREAGDATAVLRRALSGQADGSVQIVGIGPMRNLRKLLESGADALSPLNGRALIARKVARLTVMAGNFCGEPEWNVRMDAESARKVAREWPGEVVWCGWEVGKDVIALREPCALSADNPVRQAYRLWSGGAGRSSWDLCAVQWAMDEESVNYAPSVPGNVEIDARDVTQWQAQSGGRHRYLCLKVSPEKAARSMEETLEAFDREREKAE